MDIPATLMVNKLLTRLAAHEHEIAVLAVQVDLLTQRVAELEGPLSPDTATPT